MSGTLRGEIWRLSFAVAHSVTKAGDHCKYVSDHVCTVICVHSIDSQHSDA